MTIETQVPIDTEMAIEVELINALPCIHPSMYWVAVSQTQHPPRRFTTIWSAQINRKCGRSGCWMCKPRQWLDWTGVGEVEWTWLKVCVIALDHNIQLHMSMKGEFIDQFVEIEGQTMICMDLELQRVTKTGIETERGKAGDCPDWNKEGRR